MIFGKLDNQSGAVFNCQPLDCGAIFFRLLLPSLILPGDRVLDRLIWVRSAKLSEQGAQNFNRSRSCWLRRASCTVEESGRSGVCIKH